MAFFVYLVECSDGSYYCGWTKDLGARVKAHNSGKGGKYTGSRRPVRLVYFEGKESRAGAMRREAEIKSFSRKKKRNLVEGTALAPKS